MSSAASFVSTLVKLQTVYLGEYTHPATWEESAHVKTHRTGSNNPTLVYES